MSDAEKNLEVLARVDAATKVFHVVIAAVVHRLPAQDRDAIRNMVASQANALAEAYEQFGIGPNANSAVEVGARYLHLETRRLLAHIDGSPPLPGDEA
ncbi:hypothetical protein [Paracraurococcus lichenis]|uniref:Uncharacterized protein n=1 Tax=Paracraurococcus lichenis TaxID=3064888 RepID=A0ABT9EE73_9PROT|nr:hypothetical protein [Paracraurococcus sp. LOR1-02]MDO9714508.1 hypothetical protein [Paracraurococcus sp. LOR1-02]